MNWPIFLAPSPLGMVLVQWTALLALAWTAHGLLRNSHARWRLILWRGALCFGLVLPLVPLLPAPDFSIGIPIVRAPEMGSADARLTVASGVAILKHSTLTLSAAKGVGSVTAVKSPVVLTPLPPPTAPERGSKGQFLFVIWVLGGMCGAMRLIWLQIELARLRKAAGLAEPSLRKLAREIQARLGVKRTIEVRVSDSIGSPFICGPLKPVIMLPKTLARTLASVELSALLAHEIAHFRQRDLIWCVGWRWMKAICWFHPLVWNVPAAHSLACEEEADRIACAQFGDRGSYAQWLAQLALRVLALPDVETGLALNGTAQIVRRLNHLKREGLGAWKWWCSVVGVVAVGLIFFMIYGSTDEPVYHFKSVTQWLDSMAMFDELRTLDQREMDENARGGFNRPRSPEIVTNDPALRALLAMGSKAVPTLVKTLNEPPLPPPRDPMKMAESLVERIWRQLHGAGTGAPASEPSYVHSFQEARKTAAGLAMLALGTNHNAGSLRLIEIAAARQSKGYRDISLYHPFAVASTGLPERHKEIIAGIVAGLNDSNASIQLCACGATLPFHTNLPEWRDKLLELARGPDVNISLGQEPPTYVNQWALWSLACADAGDEVVMDLCEKAVQDKTRPPQLRSFAATGLGMGGDKAEHALPILRAVLTEQGIPKRSNLQHAARRAIDEIEKSVALHNAKGHSTATAK